MPGQEEKLGKEDQQESVYKEAITKPINLFANFFQMLRWEHGRRRSASKASVQLAALHSHIHIKVFLKNQIDLKLNSQDHTYFNTC